MAYLLSKITKRKGSETATASKMTDAVARFNAAMRKRSRTATASTKTAGKSAGSAIMPIGKIEQAILLVRGEKVILDADLSALYGVDTKVLNQAVKRNVDRFPEDFMFRLTQAEKSEVVTNCDHLERLKFSPVLPWAFTEHGAIMAANVLSSPRAVQASVFVVRAFVRLRRMLLQHTELAAKLTELEGRVEKHDRKIIALIDAIRQLMAPPPEPPRKKLGFQSEVEP
jgi:hypothetical protein